MVKEVDPKGTKRALAYELWMKAPMPMMTLIRKLDVTSLVKASHRHGYKINMLMCWCIGKAASEMEEFYMLPVGDKLMQYENLAISTVVATGKESISTCDIPFSYNLDEFSKNYIELTKRVQDTGEIYDLSTDYMVIGTSALAEYEIDGAVNIYAGIYNNPFLIWGKIQRKLFHYSLPVSFQFHHTQMDGVPAAHFFSFLQNVINKL